MQWLCGREEVVGGVGGKRRGEGESLVNDAKLSINAEFPSRDGPLCIVCWLHHDTENKQTSSQPIRL